MAKKPSKTKLKNKHQNKQSKGKNKKKRSATKSGNQKVTIQRKKEPSEPVSGLDYKFHGGITVDASLEDIDHLIDENGIIKSFSEDSYRNGGEPVAKRRKKGEVEEQQAYDRLPRKLRQSNLENDGTGEGTIQLLPIKSKDGLIQRSRTAIENPDEEQILENGDTVEDMETELESSNPELTMIEIYAKREENISENKRTIARLCGEILENPDANINNLKKLLEFCCKDQIVVIQKLAVVSLCEIFKDIVPGYRIRPLTEQEKTSRVSKDIKKLRDFEDALITNYRKYLDILEEMIQDFASKKSKKNPSENADKSNTKVSSGLAFTATRCMSELLLNLNHFNYRTNLIVAVVSRMNLDGDKKQIGDLCNETIKSMFKNDEIGDVSVEALKVICRMMKSKLNQTRPQVLEALLHLNINSQMVKEAEGRETKIERIRKRKEEIRKMSRTEKKRKKLESKLDKELQETEAVESRQKIQRFQTDILKSLFVIYFRVLKQEKRSPLLTPVLKGLSRYAHLISVDFFSDLMKSLKRLINSGELSLTESLNCVLTSFKILSGQGEALNIDLHHFYLHLYNSLVNIGADCRQEDYDLCLECLDIMLLKRRKQVSLRRILGFLKRTATVSLQLESEDLLSMMGLMRGVLQLNQKCDILLDNETIGRGVFQPELTDPEHCNAESTVLWELLLLLKHYSLDVRDYARHLLQGAPSQGQGALSKSLLQRNHSESPEDPPLQYYFPGTISSSKAVKKSKISAVKWIDSLFEDHTKNIHSSVKEYDLDYAKFIWKSHR